MEKLISLCGRMDVDRQNNKIEACFKENFDFHTNNRAFGFVSDG